MKRFLIIILCITCITAFIYGGCGGGSSSSGSSASSDPTLLWTVTNNSSSNSDYAKDIAIDSNYMYVAGADRSAGFTDGRWRIEKRSLANGVPITSFGTSGVVVSNPSSSVDEPEAIAIDSSYMYVVGYDYSPGASNSQWRIEKLNLTDGLLVNSFGTSGVITSNPSTLYDEPQAVTIDSSYMYIAGYDGSQGNNNAQWRIEKRNLTDGLLVGAFGSGGVITSNPSANNDIVTTIAIDSSYMYVAGSEVSPGSDVQWRIEKRNLSDGLLVNSFGTSGVITSNPSTGITGDDVPTAIAIDSPYMYIIGYDHSLGNYQWRIEKRSLANGSFVSSFGTSGVIVSNPSDVNPSDGIDRPYGIAIDSVPMYMYIVGYDNILGNTQWRIEKRSLTDGALVSGFGTGGVITSNPSASNEVPWAVAIDSTAIYAVGFDGGPGFGDVQWRIEKRSK